MLTQRYTTNFSSLTPAEAGYLATAIQRRTPAFVAAEGGEYESGEELMHHVDAYGLDQADVVMSLARDSSPEAYVIIEKLICPHEITRVAPRQTSKARSTTPRAPRAPKTDNRVIASVAPNPKRPGTASHTRYENYRVGMTVTEAVAAGLTTGDIRWDTDKGFITFEEAGK